MKVTTLKLLRRVIRAFRRLGLVMILFSIFALIMIVNPETNITVNGSEITNSEARLKLIGIPISFFIIALVLVFLPKNYWYRYFLLFKK